MKISKEDKEKLAEQTKTCGICKKDFKKDDIKCLDHCHFTGEIRGFTH